MSPHFHFSTVLLAKTKREGRGENGWRDVREEEEKGGSPSGSASAFRLPRLHGTQQSVGDGGMENRVGQKKRGRGEGPSCVLEVNKQDEREAATLGTWATLEVKVTDQYTPSRQVRRPRLRTVGPTCNSFWSFSPIKGATTTTTIIPPVLR